MINKAEERFITIEMILAEQALKEAIENPIKSQSEETPPPHY